MASQINDTREYTSVKEESVSPEVTKCPLCQVKAVPRKINSTRKIDGTTKASTPRHCPNCGHVYGRLI